MEMFPPQQVLRYKETYLTHNFLQNIGVALRRSLTCEERQVTRHREGQTGYFVEMLGHVFCSVGGQHFVLVDVDDENLDLRPVDLPTLNGFALEPRCVDEARRRIYFDTEKYGFCVTLDDDFDVICRSQFASARVTPDHAMHIIEGHVVALKLGQQALVLDERQAEFVFLDDYIHAYGDLPRQPCLPDANLLRGAKLLPQIRGIIYKMFNLDGATFMIVTEAVELTQARLRISETESDPRVVGFFKWSSVCRCWRDVAAVSRIPRSQIQQAIVLNHPGVPIYSRRPCYN